MADAPHRKQPTTWRERRRARRDRHDGWGWQIADTALDAGELVFFLGRGVLHVVAKGLDGF